MESAAGNERALTSSVTCTAEAPAALPVYKEPSVSASRLFHQSFLLHSSVTSVYVSLVDRLCRPSLNEISVL